MTCEADHSVSRIWGCFFNPKFPLYVDANPIKERPQTTDKTVVCDHHSYRFTF